MCPATSALWKNGGSDPDAVWHHRSDGSSDEAGGGVWRSVHGKRYFGGEFGARHCLTDCIYTVEAYRSRSVFVAYASSAWWRFATEDRELSE